MRIWTLHPSYLDQKGLVAVWREGLLALQVLSGKTKGYLNHPQLSRFKMQPDPVASISAYLHVIANEADKRSYNFNREKLPVNIKVKQISVTKGQFYYEINHLKNKLQIRDIKKLFEIEKKIVLITHPLFKLIDGDVEDWEILKK